MTIFTAKARVRDAIYCEVAKSVLVRDALEEMWALAMANEVRVVSAFNGHSVVIDGRPWTEQKETT